MNGVAEQVVVESRPGVDGEAIFKLGKRGKPFRLFSRVDMPSLVDANIEVNSYQTLIDQGPQPVVWHNVSTVGGYGFVVLDVNPVRIHALATSVGGLNSPSLAWLEAAWTLLPHQYVF